MINISFIDCIERQPTILMEGALGERLKREYGLRLDEPVVMAGLVYREDGRRALRSLWEEYLTVAEKYALPFIATTPTRRANRERVLKNGYTKDIIYDNVHFLKEIQQQAGVEMYVGGLMGSRGNAYAASEGLSAEAARDYHSWQAELFAQADADFLMAGIMPTLPEAVGIAQAMEESGLPYLISFMIRKDGNLLDGTRIHDAVEEIDQKTARPPAGYLVNCVHPDILYEALGVTENQTQTVRNRFIGIQANASPLSPEELDDAKDLHSSDAEQLAKSMLRLRKDRGLRLFGGCCGTDGSHLEAIAWMISQE